MNAYHYTSASIRFLYHSLRSSTFHLWCCLALSNAKKNSVSVSLCYSFRGSFFLTYCTYSSSHPNTQSFDFLFSIKDIHAKHTNQFRALLTQSLSPSLSLYPVQYTFDPFSYLHLESNVFFYSFSPCDINADALNVKVTINIKKPTSFHRDRDDFFLFVVSYNFFTHSESLSPSSMRKYQLRCGISYCFSFISLGLFVFFSILFSIVFCVDILSFVNVWVFWSYWGCEIRLVRVNARGMSHFFLSITTLYKMLKAQIIVWFAPFNVAPMKSW